MPFMSPRAGPQGCMHTPPFQGYLWKNAQEEGRLWQLLPALSGCPSSISEDRTQTLGFLLVEESGKCTGRGRMSGCPRKGPVEKRDKDTMDIYGSSWQPLLSPLTWLCAQVTAEPKVWLCQPSLVLSEKRRATRGMCTCVCTHMFLLKMIH